MIGAMAVATSATSFAFMQRSSPAGEIQVEGTRATFIVDYGRPMESVAYTLIQEYRWRITFEEAPLEYSGDVVDVTKDLSRGSRVFNPRGGHLEFSYELAPGGAPPPDPRPVLLSAIRAYHNANLPGRYELIVADGFYHIVPIARTSAEGILEAVRSPLEALVAIEGGNRHALLVFQDTLRAIESATGFRLRIGFHPFLRGMQPQIQQRFDQVQARSVLRSLIAASGKSRIWYMMYNIGTREYYLSII